MKKPVPASIEEFSLLLKAIDLAGRTGKLNKQRVARTFADLGATFGAKTSRAHELLRLTLSTLLPE